jgi:hypothetical protein
LTFLSFHPLVYNCDIFYLLTTCVQCWLLQPFNHLFIMLIFLVSILLIMSVTEKCSIISKFDIFICIPWWLFLLQYIWLCKKFDYMNTFSQDYWIKWSCDHVVLAINNKLIFCVGIMMLCIKCFYITDIVDIMNRKCKQWRSTMPLISSKERFCPSRASTWISNVMCRGLYCSQRFWGERWVCWYWWNCWPSWLKDFLFIITSHI